jgi:hypothetical protein
MKKINSLQDLRRYVSNVQLTEFQNKLYGYEDFEDMVTAYTDEFLAFLRDEQGFEWGDDLEDFDIRDQDERAILRAIDKS